MLIIIYFIIITIIVLTIITLSHPKYQCMDTINENYTDLLIPQTPDPSKSSTSVSKFKDIFSVYWNQYLPSDNRAKCFACEKEEELLIRG